MNDSEQRELASILYEMALRLAKVEEQMRLMLEAEVDRVRDDESYSGPH